MTGERYEKHYFRSNENCIKSRQERPVGETATRPVLTAVGVGVWFFWQGVVGSRSRYTGCRFAERSKDNRKLFGEPIFTVNERQIKQQAENESCVLT